MGAAHDDYEASFLSIPDFQAQCLELIERVADGRGEAVITRDGIAIARLISAHGPHGRPAGLWKGLIEIKGDIVGPVRADWLDASDDTEEAAT